MTERSVFIVDDDPLLRRTLERLLRSEGYEVEAYPDGRSLLTRQPLDYPACLLLDVFLPDCSGLQLQRRLPLQLQVILMSGLSGVPEVIDGIRQGALDFLVKPIHRYQLLAVVERALAEAERQWVRRRRGDELRSRLARLTPREREVFALVSEGLLNKRVAAQLAITEKTVKVHRSRVMHKLNVDSVVALARLADQLADLDAVDAGLSRTR